MDFLPPDLEKYNLEVYINPPDTYILPLHAIRPFEVSAFF